MLNPEDCTCKDPPARPLFVTKSRYVVYAAVPGCPYHYPPPPPDYDDPTHRNPHEGETP